MTTDATRYAHYTAHARMGRQPLWDEEVAGWLWVRLSKNFADAISAELMPDHLHLIAPDWGRAGATRLARVLGAVARRFELGELWRPVPLPRPLDSRDKVARNVRYAWLNCCRPWSGGGGRRLVDDPLKWRWSTLRDAIGAVTDPWVPASRVGEAFGWPIDEALPRRLHAYAVKDDHVAVEARTFPVVPPPAAMPDRAFEDVVAAGLSATRATVAELGRRRSAARRAVVGLAYRQGWRAPKELGALCGMHPDSVTRLARKASAAEVEAAARCLDARLR